MNKIQIYETDNTKRTLDYNVTSNAAYVPGFSCGVYEISYDKVTNATLDASATYYTQHYSKVVTEELDSGTTYYEITGGTSPDYEYSEVMSPVPEDIGKYYTREGEVGDYTYTKVIDNTVDPTVDYYENNNGEYVIVDSPSNDDIGKYYILEYQAVVDPSEDLMGMYYTKTEEDPDVYTKVIIETIDSSKEYYIKSGSSYTLVAEPSNDFINMYYEKVNRDITEYETIIYCDSVEKFEEKFGKDPYKFVNDQVGYTEIAAGSYDLSYIYAKELLRLGLPIYYEAMRVTPSNTGRVDDNSVATLYKKLAETELNKLTDLNEFNLKFITTGAYGVLENETVYDFTSETQKTLTEIMLNIAAVRGDALAILDYRNIPTYTKAADIYKLVTETNSVIKENYFITVANKDMYINNYGTVVCGWGTYNLKATYTNRIATAVLPGSFSYLIAFADSVQSNPNYYAIAGVTRGRLKNMAQPIIIVSGAEADNMQPDTGIAINPITKINPYGYCIWGNRTLHINEDDELVASSFLHIRLLACDLKKILRQAALDLDFEIQNDILWINFKAKIEPSLDEIVANGGIEKYKISQVPTTDRATIKAKVTIWCLYAVEKWDIELELTDSFVSVE